MKRNARFLYVTAIQDGSGYLERKELENFLVDLLANQYGVSTTLCSIIK